MKTTRLAAEGPLPGHYEVLRYYETGFCRNEPAESDYQPRKVPGEVVKVSYEPWLPMHGMATNAGLICFWRREVRIKYTVPAEA